MAGIVICEGKTDAVLISYYLYKVSGYEYSNKKLVNIPIRDVNNEICTWFKKADQSDLVIWGVGGKANIPYAAEQINELNQVQFTFDRISVIRDRDDEEEDDIINSLKGFFGIPNTIDVAHNTWTQYNVDDAFGTQNEIRFLPLIIPFTEAGALETFLLKALSEDSGNKYIIDSSIEFVNGLNDVDSIASDRMKLKAKLSVSLSVMTPDKVFTLLDEMLKEVPWETYKEIRDGFAFLDEI